jgi:hypothetical protein
MASDMDPGMATHSAAAECNALVAFDEADNVFLAREDDWRPKEYLLQERDRNKNSARKEEGKFKKLVKSTQKLKYCSLRTPAADI